MRTDGTSSSAIDLPDGGEAYIIGNLLQQGPKTANPDRIVGYGLEKNWNPSRKLYLVNNTIVNDSSTGNFVHADPGTGTFYSINNIFLGPGITYRGKYPTKEMNNLDVRSDPGLVDRYKFDYRLTGAAVRAIDRGVSPGSVNGFKLMPKYQYRHSAGIEPRPKAGTIDIGAYELQK